MYASSWRKKGGRVDSLLMKSPSSVTQAKWKGVGSERTTHCPGGAAAAALPAVVAATLAAAALAPAAAAPPVDKEDMFGCEEARARIIMADIGMSSYIRASVPPSSLSGVIEAGSCCWRQCPCTRPIKSRDL